MSTKAVSSASACFVPSAPPVGPSELHQVLVQLHEKYPHITPADFANYEQLLSRAKIAYPDLAIPLMAIKAPLSIIKKHIEIMERMKADRTRPSVTSGIVNEETWPSILSSFLDNAVMMNPSLELLEFLKEKGATLSDQMIEVLNLSDRSSTEVSAIFKMYLISLAIDEKVEEAELEVTLPGGTKEQALQWGADTRKDLLLALDFGMLKNVDKTMDYVAKSYSDQELALIFSLVPT